jgi:cell division protein FtsB
MKSSKLLAFVVTLQLLILAGQWANKPVFIAEAHAQIPDAGAQRNQIIEQLKETNQKLDRLISLLESGEVQVRVANSDEANDAPRPKAR